MNWKHLPVEAIEETLEQKVSIMPEMTKTLTRREIRDLVAYLVTDLATLKATSPR